MSLIKSNKQLVEELRTTPEPWMDAAIVVAFDDRFEFVGEDHPDPVSRLKFLLEQGGLPIAFAGLVPNSGYGRQYSTDSNIPGVFGSSLGTSIHDDASRNCPASLFLQVASETHLRIRC
jgi:hypothetical protein